MKDSSATEKQASSWNLPKDSVQEGELEGPDGEKYRKLKQHGRLGEGKAMAGNKSTCTASWRPYAPVRSNDDSHI